MSLTEPTAAGGISGKDVRDSSQSVGMYLVQGLTPAVPFRCVSAGVATVRFILWSCSNKNLLGCSNLAAFYYFYIYHCAT